MPDTSPQSPDPGTDNRQFSLASLKAFLLQQAGAQNEPGDAPVAQGGDILPAGGVPGQTGKEADPVTAKEDTPEPLPAGPVTNNNAASQENTPPVFKTALYVSSINASTLVNFLAAQVDTAPDVQADWLVVAPHNCSVTGNWKADVYQDWAKQDFKEGKPPYFNITDNNTNQSYRIYCNGYGYLQAVPDNQKPDGFPAGRQ